MNSYMHARFVRLEGILVWYANFAYPFNNDIDFFKIIVYVTCSLRTVKTRPLRAVLIYRLSLTVLRHR